MKPSSIEEAVAILQSTFQVLELQEWSAQSESSAISQAHWTLGMWVRNQWVYGGSPLVAEIKSAAGFIHDDDVSSIIIKALWHVLNGAPCPTIEELIPLRTTQHLTWD
jgi:sulfur relay (sulfurtransferase) DsrC/TusE family protein